ncbi:lactosylceramide 1,3-N-acetyl-beta-D-glucosaminyltransferase A-like [Eucyclogobius newberryi]|uniref:lactosylceramide 1,3-N-acetyl-beta-D-glucosaminyltransferase A-like n=1 Tax=Eucyclogobius newberryi TaxID=166745 RepID=UPI003B5C7D31
MLVSFRRLRRCQCVQLMTTCLVLSLVMVYWEQLDNNVVSHVKSVSFRYLVNRFSLVNKSLTIPREQALIFSNFPYLLNHPKICKNQDVLLLLFVKTSPENIQRRKAIRSTWGNQTYIQESLGVTVKVLFVLGATVASDSDSLDPQEQLKFEDKLYSDLIQQGFSDSFHNLTLKLLMQFHWMHHYCAHARFFMTADDDIFVHMPNLVQYIQDVHSKGITDLWVGRVHRGSPPVRSQTSKYYVPYSMYQWLSYPDYTAGAAYVVSSDVADKIYHASLTLNASLYIDDVFMGICANAVGVSPQEHVFFSGEAKAPYHSCIYSQMMTSHGHVEDIYDLWKTATRPQVKVEAPGLIGKLYCSLVKVALLCRPYYVNTYPCKAAFS